MHLKRKTIVLRFFIILLFPLSFACSQAPVNNVSNNIQFSPSMLFQYPYGPESAPFLINLEIEKDEEGNYYLVSTIDFRDSAYIASPFCDESMKGKLRSKLENESYASLGRIEQVSPKILATKIVINTPEDQWIREKTTYRQEIFLTSKNDFEANGKLSFTIEPRCTFELVPFVLKFKNGILTVTPGGC